MNIHITNQEANILFLISALPAKVIIKHRNKIRNIYRGRLSSYYCIQAFDYIIGDRVNIDNVSMLIVRHFQKIYD